MRAIFSKEGIRALHGDTHQCLDIVFRHGSTMRFTLLTNAIPGAPHASVRNQMVHVLMAEAFWVSNLRNRTLDEPQPEDFSSMEELLVAKREIMADTTAYLESLDEAALNTELTLRPKNWIGPLRAPAYILLHVLTHAFHHKGQMAMMYRILGHPIGDTDLQRGENHVSDIAISPIHDTLREQM